MVAPEAEAPEAVLRPPRYFSPGGFRIGSAARRRAQARGGQGEDQADPQQQIGLGFGDRRPSRPANLSAWRRRRRCRPRHRASRKAGETRIPGDVAGRDKEISLLYRLRQPDCRRQAGAATLVHRHLLW